MPLFILCPEGHRLKVPAKMAGRRIVCPVCETRISVPPLAPPPRFGNPGSTLPDSTDQQQPGDAESPLLRPVNTPRQPPASTQEVSPKAPASTNQPPASVPGTGAPDADAPDAGAPEQSAPGLDETSPLLQALAELELLESQHSESLAQDLLQLDLDQPLRGYRGTQPGLIDDRQWSILILGLASILVAVLCAVPSVMDHYAAREIGQRSADAWTYLVLLGSLVQIAVAIYTIRIPDWSTSWFASLVITGFAAIYALGLALTMFASQDHRLVNSLGLLDEAFRGRAQPWCFLVMCVTLILAFFYGRFSLRWYHLDQQLAASRS